MKNEIDERLFYNNNKLVADKIRKTLLNIRNVPGISAKRWIWELIQNAKDVPNKFNRVEIIIELTKKSLKFMHNGQYFTIENILGILQQVSSKDSNNRDDQTGKFGTGFIGTHLLSGKVIIKGVVKYGEIYKRFKIFLDRSADSSEILSESVSGSIDNFRNNMNNSNSEYELMRVYDQKQNDFDTVFEYLFDDKNKSSLQSAVYGLNDLINTAPATLSTQYKKISKITIIDKISDKTTEYSNNHEKLENDENEAEIGMSTITIKTNNKLDYKYFYSYTTDICMLLYEVTKNDSGQFIVVERREDQPNLFRDFPLIGSEKFHFPFFLDGFKFNPLETRNGLYLNGELNEEAIENRKIITEAIKSSINFTKWLLEENIDKRYLLAKSNIPEPPQRYDTIAIDWFIQQQKNWRAKLAELRLIKNKKGNYNKLKLLKLPIFKEKFNIEFFKLFTELNVTEANIPIVEEAEIWYKILEDDPLKKVYDKNENTWNFSYAFTEIDLLRKIKGFGTIQEFASKMVTDTKSVISWLNRLCNFFQKNDCMNYICEYEIIPNKNGKFIKTEDLCRCEKENSIPSIINPIYFAIFGKEINEMYVHQDIKFNSLEKYINKKNFKHILNEFSNFFKENNEAKKKEYLCKQLISLVDGEPKIKRMLEITVKTDENFKFNPNEKLNNYLKNHSVWRDVEEYWFNFHSSFIELIKNIDDLRKLLNFKDTNEGRSESINWLNNYILFLKENSTIVEKKKIFPNQLGIFDYLENLQYDEEIPEILKDIYNKLNTTNNRREEVRKQLLLKGITSYRGYNRFTQKEIIGKIEKLFNKSKDLDKKIEISEQILSLIPNKNEPKSTSISNALRRFIPYYNQIQGKNLAFVETDATTELNYGIFLNFILDNTLNLIQSWSKNEIISKKEIIPKIIKFIWDYQSKEDENKYLNILVDVTKYELFISQNDENVNINNLSYTINFDLNDLNKPEIAQLFEVAKLDPINLDYKNKILCKSFLDELRDYSNKFKQLKLDDICKNEIDNKIVDYYEKNKSQNLLREPHLNFIKVFFKLNSILKASPYLKAFFPRLIRNRGTISISFLEFTSETDMEDFIDDIRKMVSFELAK